MSVLHAIVLGVVQGATEFLPISSKSHLIVVPALLGWKAPRLPFLVLLHFGSLIALVAYFLRDLLAMAAGLTGSRDGRRRLAMIVVASIPAAVFGLAFEKTFERLLTHPRAVAISLVATAAILVVAEWAAGTIGGRRRLPKPLREHVEWPDVVRMGIAQTFALLPGVSRSGVTMSAGLAGGLARDAAARFSFLMALAAVAGASLVEGPKIVDAGLGAAQVAGFLASLVTSFLVIAGLLRWLRRHNFLPFAAYCLVIAVIGAIRL